MTLREVQSVLGALRAERNYYTGQIVYDLHDQCCAEVVEARPASATYKLSSGRWAHASDLEDPLRESYRRDARANLESRHAALQRSARRTMALWVGMVVLQVSALILVLWLG